MQGVRIQELVFRKGENGRNYYRERQNRSATPQPDTRIVRRLPGRPKTMRCPACAYRYPSGPPKMVLIETTPRLKWKCFYCGTELEDVNPDAQK